LRQSFPIHALNPLHGGKPAWRLGKIAEYILSNAPEPQVTPRKTFDDLNLITMVGKSHFLQLRESLLSLARTWSEIPRVIVLSDGSWEEWEFLRHFAWWPGEMTIKMPAQIKKDLLARGFTSLAEFTGVHPLSLKLGFIVSEAMTARIMFSDSDILWFRDPVGFLKRHSWATGVAASVETIGSFNDDLARASGAGILEPPFTNSGIVLLSGPLFPDDERLEGVLGLIRQREHEFNEQTIIALAVLRHGHHLPTDFLVNEFSDPYALTGARAVLGAGAARHYVRFMRHQMYRASLGLRVRCLFGEAVKPYRPVSSH
jgi:hypothetical protein